MQFRFCLDLQRMSATALQRLGDTHEPARQALLGEVATLLRRMLVDRSFSRTLATAPFLRQLLEDPKVSLQEVAFLVGYSSDRAFRRAVRRWTGMTPTQIRHEAIEG